MFDKKRFKELLQKAIGDRNNSEYEKISGVNRTYISKYLNERLDNPPTPDVIKRMASAAQNNVTYEDFMKAAGHIPDNIKTENNVLTEKDEKDIAKKVENLKKELMESQGGLMFDGFPASPEAIESVLEALEFGIRQAKIINKKYTPKKYRKNQNE